MEFIQEKKLFLTAHLRCQTVFFRGVDGDIVSNEFCFAHSNKTPTWSCSGDVNNANKRCQSSSQQFFDRAVRGIDLAFTAKSAEAVEGGEVPVGLSNFTYALTDPGNIGEIKWDITLCLLLSWVVCFGCLVKGIKSSGKVRTKCRNTFISLTLLLARLSTSLQPSPMSFS